MLFSWARPGTPEAVPDRQVARRDALGLEFYRARVLLAGTGELFKSLSWGGVSVAFPRSPVQGSSHRVEVFLGVHGQDGAAREILSEELVQVLVRAALPGRVRVGEEHRDLGSCGDLPVSVQLGALIPRHRSRRPRRERAQDADQLVADGEGTWFVLGNAEEEAFRGGAVHERPDRATVVLPDDQIPLEVTGDLPCLRLGRPLPEGHHVLDPTHPRVLSPAGPPHPPSGPS